jgi:hypothetical protein
VSGHQDRARHEEIASRTRPRPHHCIPRRLRRAELWQNETFSFICME